MIPEVLRLPCKGAAGEWWVVCACGWWHNLDAARWQDFKCPACGTLVEASKVEVPVEV